MTPGPFQDSIADLYLNKRRSYHWIGKKYKISLKEILEIADAFKRNPLWQNSNFQKS